MVGRTWRGVLTPGYFELCNFPSPVAVVQLLSCISLFATPWTAACQTSLSFTLSQSLLRFSESVMLSKHLLLCHALLLLPSVFPSIRVFSLSLRKLLSHVWLCDLMDYIVHGVFQARILEWVAVPFSRGSSQPRDQTQVSCTAGGFFTSWATREALSLSCL